MKIKEEYPDFLVDHSLFGFMLVDDTEMSSIDSFDEEDEDEE